MKRTPLLRKTPMKRSTKPMRRVSEKREDWNRRYLAAIESDADEQRCALTGQRGHKGSLERHHPLGRLNERIMVYFYITPERHTYIHDNAKAARTMGLLQNEFFGYNHDPEQPNPWKGKEPVKKL